MLETIPKAKLPNSYYCQCILKDVGSGKIRLCWVDKHLAKPNKLVCLEGEPGFDTWKIMMVGTTAQPGDTISSYSAVNG